MEKKRTLVELSLPCTTPLGYLTKHKGKYYRVTFIRGLRVYGVSV